MDDRPTSMAEVQELLQEVRRELRAARRASWGRPQTKDFAELRTLEIQVLLAILDKGVDWTPNCPASYTDIVGCFPKLRPAAIGLALGRLEKLKLIEHEHNSHGEFAGYFVNDAGRSWLEARMDDLPLEQQSHEVAQLDLPDPNHDIPF